MSQSHQQNNFEAAHTFYSQAVVALSDPYSFSFTLIRNSNVSDIQSLKTSIEKEDAEPKINKTLDILREARNLADSLKTSKDELIQCQNAIQSLMISTPAPGVTNNEPDSDEEKSDEEEEWEIIQT
ncbi:hypothetical protein M9Y10_008364 [Tritrichomonas musculus]|uniref:Uncharacterized protein n=1 Tax=Tritrichomonas musculus TaxID=1915356 RepID=A0ABR2IY02_9EUKA